MARIVVDAYFVRCPLGGFVSWVMQYLRGFADLGHDVWFVERAEFEKACYDPVRMQNGDDCTHGVEVIEETFERFGLAGRWCFVDIRGRHFGMTETKLDEILRTADLFVDLGPYGAWLDRIRPDTTRVMIDAEPGFTQMRFELDRREGKPLLAYDHYYSIGRNIGTEASACPTAGLDWRHIFQPVLADRWERLPEPEGGAFTTVMNWQSHNELEFDGETFGQKDLEFARFLGLPGRTGERLSVAVSRASDEVKADLRNNGWQVESGQGRTMTLDAYYEHINGSRGEFSVSKHVFVATNCAWFSDRSAIYLACGRPVVLQDCGFSAHLPCGEGLFAVRNADEAASAFEAIRGDYARHSRAAREIAVEHLDARRVLSAFLDDLA